MGESYGRYVLGNDRDLIPFVPTINIAAGYHAADPGTIHTTVKLAKEFGAEVGAHIAYPDFMGFGRRRMALSEREVFEISVYQIGAVLGFCRAENMVLNHVKPHGELFLTGVWDRSTARGIVQAMKAVDPNLLLIMAGDLVAAECETAGIQIVQEGYADLDYNADGTIILDRVRGARDVFTVASNALSLAERQGRESTEGNWVAVPTESICVHGDMANATDLARGVNRALIGAGHQIISTRELVRRRK